MTVYTDQPIPFTDQQREQFTPRRIRAMRGIGGAFETEAKIFVAQGRFMADFEDDFDFRGAVIQYFPTYRALMDAQLRGYFSWRTKVRRGDVRRTSLSFAFLHIYELLNQIGVPSPEDGCRMLRDFWAAYRAMDTRIDGYMEIWLKDYIIYNNLDRALLNGLPDVEFDRALSVIQNRAGRAADEVFGALNSLSDYNLEESKFFAQRPDEVKRAVAQVFDAVAAYLSRKDPDGARDKLFGRVSASGYTMFRSAVFDHGSRQADRVYEIGANHKYLCTNGRWTCERFVGYGKNNKTVGAVLRTVDYCLREAFGHKSSLQPGKVNKTLFAKIAKSVDAFAQQAQAREAIRIDTSKLQGIRDSALKTQERLLVEEEAAEKAEAPEPRETAALSHAERDFLAALLRGETPRAGGTPASVLIDAINEKLFDRFNDTVIVDGFPVDDYVNDLKGMFPA